MARIYSDGFFKLCSVLIESHETVSIRSLAPFLEVARTTMRDGIKRIDNQTVNEKDYEDMVVDIIKWYFDNSGNTISSYMTDDELQDLYHYEPKTTPQNATVDEDLKVDGEQIEFDLDDEEFEEEYGEKLRKENKKRNDESLGDYVYRLAKQKQRSQDVTRVERAMFRNTVRACNMVEELNEKLIDLLDERRDKIPNIQRSTQVTKKKSGEDVKVGVLQVSDLHFGELVKETLENRYDLEIASKRLQKFIDRSIKLFKADDITDVAVFMTGDMINSTRRISEITTYADARTKVVFNAFLILGNMLEHLYEHFNVTVAHVVGNESRLSEYFDTTNYLVSDNFDLLLYQMLKHTHERKGLNFIFEQSNPMEQVVDVNGVNFLLVHGNGHKGLSQTNKIESEVEKLKARYANSGVIVNYVLCGHIHSTYIGNNFARSASTVGSNAYAERNLNFTSKASQNAFVVHSDGTIDGYMIDLQKYDGYDGYEYDRDTVMYMNDNQPTTVLIQKVLI